MPSLRARFVNLILPLLGIKARFASAQALSMALTDNPPVCVRPSALMRLRFKVTEREVAGMHVYVVAPKHEAKSAASVLYLHGGAYVHELTGDHWRLIRGLVQRSGATIHVPSYPLAPSKTCAHAFPPVRELARELLDASGTSVTFMGDSAGGGFALALAQSMRDDGERLPDRIVLLSPWLDVETNHPAQASLAHKDRILAAPGLQWAGRQWAGTLSTGNPRVSPLNGSLEGLPPIALLAGTSDLLYVDAERLREQARLAGHQLHFMPYQDMFHVWMAAPIPEAGEALDDVASFMRTVQ